MRTLGWVMRDPRRWSRAAAGARLGRLAGVPGRDRFRRLPPPLLGLDGEPRPAEAAAGAVPRLVGPAPRRG